MNPSVSFRNWHRTAPTASLISLGLPFCVAQHPSSELDEIRRKDAAKKKGEASLDSVLIHVMAANPLRAAGNLFSTKKYVRDPPGCSPAF